MSLGPGTGKSFSCFSWGYNVVRKKIERVILSRPAVEAGEKLGFHLRHERKSGSLFKTFI